MKHRMKLPDQRGFHGIDDNARGRRDVHEGQQPIRKGKNTLKTPMFFLQTFTLSSEQCFRLLFASNIVGLVGFLVMLASLWRERRMRQSETAPTSRFVVFHVYEPILYLLLACSVVTLCLLAIPGPFPTVPQWFYGADFKAGVMDTGSVVAYWLYWFVFELMATGFGILFLFDVLLANTFIKALLIAITWAAVAATALVHDSFPVLPSLCEGLVCRPLVSVTKR
jgi:hypothetical protein